MRFYRQLTLFTLLTPIWAQNQPSAPADSLGRIPIKRVVLYKSGVGYFEHVGKVTNSQDVTIPFTSGQLNDVLKSLTVLDLNGGKITGVGYGSSAPADRQLGEIRLPVGEKASLSEFLGALRGARLEVRNGTTTITGRLLSVERKTRVSGGTTLEVDFLSLLADNGEIRTTELTPSFSVKMLERGLSGKVDRYLDLASAGREADVRRMVVSTAGTGERNLFISYISEVPVWKATYRIVLNAKQKPLLQGWAIVDNTVGQDWENVELSLVAGAPQSFIQNLSQPYYARRPNMPLPRSYNSTPQTYEATLTTGAGWLSGVVSDPTGDVVAGASVKIYDKANNLVGQTLTGPNGAYSFLKLPDGEMRVEVDFAGFRPAIMSGIVVTGGSPARADATLNIGSVTESVEVRGSVPRVQTQSSTLRGGVRGGIVPRQFAPPQPPPPPPALGVDEARLQMESSASAQELGDLFEYKLKEPISIQRNRSALVPIVQSLLALEKVSVWNEESGSRRPVRALWLTNSTNLTLDGGSFSVLEEETFAGEGVFEPIRPAEKRLVSYATDLGLTTTTNTKNEQERISRIIINKGVMVHEREAREKKTYTFRNEDSSPRNVIVEHPRRPEYELRGDARPTESTSAWLRFRVPVESKQTTSLVVEEVRPVQTTYALSDITPDHIALFATQKALNPQLEAALRRILAQKDVLSDIERRKEARENESERIGQDQQRLRENMKALKGSAEEKALLQRYTQQLNTQENRLETLDKEVEKLEAEEEKAQAELDKMIESLSLDIKL